MFLFTDVQQPKQCNMPVIKKLKVWGTSSGTIVHLVSETEKYLRKISSAGAPVSSSI